MKTKALTSLFVILVAFAWVVVGTSTVQAQELVKMPFTLNWKFGGIHGFIFLAQDRGYFKDEGIDVQIDAGDGSANVVNRVASGAYEFGYGNIAAVIKFNAKNPDKLIKAIYNVVPADMSVVSLKGRGITKPKDLEGRKIGAPVGDTAYKMFPVFVAATGIAPKTIVWNHMSSKLRQAMLIKGNVDAVTANEGTAYFGLKAAGIKDSDMIFLRYSDFGVNLINLGVMTSAKTAKEKPDLVGKVVRAFNRGFVDGLKNNEAALDALMKRDPLLNRKIEKARLDYFIKRMVTQTDVKENGLGFYKRQTIQQSIDIISGAEVLPHTPKPEDVYTTEFLPPASDRQIP